MQSRRVRGFGRVRRRLQLPLLELSCAERIGLHGDEGCGIAARRGDADSAQEVRCGECFSLIYWTYPDGSVGVPYGTLIEEPSLKPTHHQFVGSKAPWYEILDDLPQHDEYPWS